MKKKLFLYILLGANLLGGCTVNTQTDSPTLMVDYSKSPPPQSNPETLQELEGKSLTLANALTMTLEKNPELKAFSYDLRASEARIIQASILPNPEISVAVEDVWGTGGYKGSGQSQRTLQLSQVIELGGKRSARTDLATISRDQVRDSYEIKRVEILTSLTEKFIRVTADEQLLELATKAENLAKSALQNVKKRTKAGAASDLEEAKANVLLSRAHIAQEHAKHALETSKRELASFWGSDTPSSKQIFADLFTTKNLPTFENLTQRIDQSLEIKRWVNEKRLREAEYKLAQAKRIPNLTLGAGPRRLETTEDDTWVFQLSIPLPIFDRNQGTREEAQALVEKTSIDEESARLRLKTVLFGLYQELKHAKTEMETMKREIIPQAERSLKIAQEGYEQGRLAYLELVDSQRTLLEVYRENIEASYSFHQYINSIERLLGSPFTNENS